MNNRTTTTGSADKLTGTWRGKGRKINSKGEFTGKAPYDDLSKTQKALFNKWRAKSGTNNVKKDRIAFAKLANPPRTMNKDDWALAKESKRYSLRSALLEMQMMLPFADDEILQLVVDDIENGDYTVADFLEFSGLTDDEIFPEEDQVYTQEEQMAEEIGLDIDSITDPGI